MAARKIVRRSCLGARPRYNLVVDEDVKKSNKQTNKSPQNDSRVYIWAAGRDVETVHAPTRGADQIGHASQGHVLKAHALIDDFEKSAR